MQRAVEWSVLAAGAGKCTPRIYSVCFGCSFASPSLGPGAVNGANRYQRTIDTPKPLSAMLFNEPPGEERDRTRPRVRS